MYLKKQQVASSEIGQSLKTKTISLINLIQDCESLHIDSLTQLNQDLVKQNAGVFLNYRQIQIYSRPVYRDNLIIKTFPTETKAFYGYRNTIIYNEQNEVVVASKSMGAYVQVKTLKNARLSKETLDGIENYENDHNLLDYPRKVLIPATKPVKCEPFKIYDYHMDKHQHLNNAYYIEFAEAVLQPQLDYNVIRVEHRVAVKAKEELEPLLYVVDSAKQVVVLLSNETITSIVEFLKVDNLTGNKQQEEIK
ncbi:MAG: acyl-ACP thioesterase domain-containing protein [Acholeplasmataceae bacterium]